MQLDKDILEKGNKIYSPETCIFVPNNINVLFVKRESLRGEYPIGVYFNKRANKYTVKCNNGKGVQIDLGYFITIKEAFLSYKSYKEKLIKEIANEYRNMIPVKLYDAMITYEVDITD